MSRTPTTQPGAEMTLGDGLFDDYLVLPRLAMNQVGAAAQTLGAVYRLTNNNLFHQVERVAEVASLKPPTCRRHFTRLCQSGWMKKIGRQRRRTVTYKLTDTAKIEKRPYGALPRWAAAALGSWSGRAVFSLMVSRHRLIDEQGIDMCGDRSFFSIEHLMRDTGLSRPSVVSAKQQLEARGLVYFDRDGNFELNTECQLATPDNVAMSSEDTDGIPW